VVPAWWAKRKKKKNPGGKEASWFIDSFIRGNVITYDGTGAGGYHAEGEKEKGKKGIFKTWSAEAR